MSAVRKLLALLLAAALLTGAGMTGALAAEEAPRPLEEIPGDGEIRQKGETPERWTVDPRELPEGLSAFLSCFGWYGMFGPGTFDASAIGEGNTVLGGPFELLVNFDAYPGEGTEQWVDGDPRGRWGWCYGYDAEKTDWILENIFNYTPEDIAWARAWGEDPARDYYYEDGMYYVFQGGVGGGFDAYPCYVETDGTYYYVTYISYLGDGYVALDGISYAVVKPKEIDGTTWWSLYYWSGEVPPSEGAVLGELAGEWVLAEDPNSGLSIDTAPDGTAALGVRFYRMASFTANAVSMPDGKTAIFTDTDPESGFSGWLTQEGDRITLHVIPMPSWGEDPWGGYFDGDFQFHRAGSAAVPEEIPADAEPQEIPAPEETFSITPEELEREIEAIRGYYYDPGPEEQKITLYNGAGGWNYSRDYTFHNGRLVFAFIFDGTEEHRLYFKDDHMIRYIDENHTVYDFGALDPYADWAERALDDAYAQIGGRPAPVSAGDSPWLGTWYSDGGESLEVTAVSDSAVTLIYNGWDAAGVSMFHTEYVLPFTDESKTSCAEPDSVLEQAGWRYGFILDGGTITMTSRYPDQIFHR